MTIEHSDCFQIFNMLKNAIMINPIYTPLYNIPDNLIGTNSQKWSLGSKGILIVRY